MTLMEVKPVSKPVMVSKLPKFGSRPVSSPCSLPNGSVQARQVQDSRSVSVKSSAVVRPTSLSVKRTKDTVSLTQDQDVPGTQINKKPAMTVRKPTSSVLSPKPGPKSLKPTSSPREDLKTGQTSQTSQFSSKLSSPSRLIQKGGVASSEELQVQDRLKASGAQNQVLQRPRDGPGPGSPQSSCGSRAPPADRMVRSQSFTHIKDSSSANLSIPRSFSFNKAVELAKPLTNTQLRPLHTNGLKPPQCFALGKSWTDRSSSEVPQSGLKKPIHVFTKPSSMSFRVNHSFTTKTQRDQHQIRSPLLISPSNQNAQSEKSAADLPDGEEMSFSPDLLEEFDQSRDGFPDDRHLDTPTRTRLSNYLYDDWKALTGVLSDVEPGSSLSPSNSSGGTYIWDEEMIEPHSYTRDTCDITCDSRLSTTDCVNNAVNGKMFDFEDNLILDLPEDGEIHNGGTLQCKCSEGRKQRQTGSNLSHNNRLVMVQGIDGSPVCGSDDRLLAFEEFSVNQMLQECCSVKSQLLQLKLLLQMEDAEINTNQLNDVNRSALQVQMLKEVEFLREELKNKDKIITQLTNKQQQQQKLSSFSDIKTVKVQKADKSTQTPRRPTGLSLWSCSPPRTTTTQHTHTSAPSVYQPVTLRAPLSGTGSKFSHHRGPQ